MLELYYQSFTWNNIKSFLQRPVYFQGIFRCFVCGRTERSEQQKVFRMGNELKFFLEDVLKFFTQDSNVLYIMIFLTEGPFTT